jgi:hypothetical protein
MKKKTDTLTWDVLYRLVERINRHMKDEQEALTTDDPDGTCAANHRGAIHVCGFFLKEINDLINEK